MIKDLNINGIVHAKYAIDKNILYLKGLVKFYNRSLIDSEQICIGIIKLIEEEKFITVAYLPEKASTTGSEK